MARRELSGVRHALLHLIVLAILFAPLVPRVQAQEARTPAVEWTACWFETGPTWPRADCGILEVAENRDRPNGRTVKLPFIVFRAFKPRLGEAPVVVTGGGGPGASLLIDPAGPEKVGRDAWYAYAYMSVEDGRDLILMDNRGVGSSRPRLNCLEVEEQTVRHLQQPSTPHVFASQRGDAYRACRQRLTALGVDLSAYNSVAAARDIEDLRAALDLEALNLYGVSYGTRIALTYAREFPKHARALVLDGVDPPERNLYEVLPFEHFRAFKRLFELCRRQSDCNERYGDDLYERFVAYLKDLGRSPVTLKVTDPKSLKPMKVWLTPEVLTTSLFYAMYNEAKIVELPRLIVTAINGGTDYVSNLVREEYLKAFTVHSLDEGAYASYACSEDVPFDDFSIALAEAAKYPIQSYMSIPWLLAEQAICEAWSVPAGSPIEEKPVVSEVPTLLFSGELDPVTPPHWAEEAARHLQNAQMMVWPAIGHAVVSASWCADAVAGTFLTEPLKNPFRLGCIAEPNTLTFVVE